MTAELPAILAGCESVDGAVGLGDPVCPQATVTRATTVRPRNLLCMVSSIPLLTVACQSLEPDAGDGGNPPHVKNEYPNHARLGPFFTSKRPATASSITISTV